MKNPLQLIKEGVLTKNLDLVSQGYTALTGEILNIEESSEESKENKTPLKKSVKKTAVKKKVAPKKVVKKKAGRPKKIEVVESDTDDYDDEYDDFVDDVESYLEDLDDKVRATKDIRFTNNFVDFGTRDDESNKIIYPRQRARSRPPARKVKTKCDDCGRIDELPPALARNDMLYYCNKCSRKKKGR